MKPRVDYTLYLCTDRDLMTTDSIEEAVELAIKAMHIPTDILIKLSRFYNTSIDYLLDQTDVKEPYARRVEK